MRFTKQLPSRSHHQVDEHGVVSHPDASACFLNWVLTMNGCRKYFASSTTVVTTRSWPFGYGARSKYSVSEASSLYGTPFFRRYPARMFVVTPFSTPPFGDGALPSRPRPGVGNSHRATDVPCQLRPPPLV